jgi:hypothetical protein
MTTKEETVQFVELLWATWPNSDQSAAAKKVHYEAWHRIIHDLPYDQCTKALDEFVIEDKPWAPRPGTIRRRVIDMKDPDGAAPTSAEAWAQFQRNLNSATSGTDFIPLHPLVAKAVNQIGATAERGLHTNGDRDMFGRVYDQILRTSDIERYGISE